MHEQPNRDGAADADKECWDGLEARLEAAAARFEERVRRVTDSLDEHLEHAPPAPDGAEAVPATDDEIIELLEANEALESRLSELKIRCEHLEKALSKAETQLKRHKPSDVLEAQLEELSARCRELEAGKAAVEAAVGRNAGTLLAVAREMRLPLRGTLGLLEPLHGARRIEDRHVAGLAAAEASVRMLLSLLDSFEDLAAIEDGRFELNAAVFDVHQTLNDALAIVKPVAASLGLEASLSIDPRVPQRLSGDPDRLQRLLLHVSSQAIGFALQGAVGVHAAVESSSDSGLVVRFSVHSDGAGVPIERLRELLDPVTAAGTSHGGERVDMRLGMLMYKQLTEMMGGRLGVEAVAGGGFAIWFSLGLDQPGTLASQRRAGRRLQEMLVCSLGPIIDLSVGGMRVLCRKPPRQRLDVTITEAGRKLRLKATLVWARRLDSTYVEAGLRFVQPSKQQVEMLHRISLQHAIRRSQAGEGMALPEAAPSEV